MGRRGRTEIERRRAVLCAAAVALLATCGGSDLLGPDAPQGIDGLVLRGPLCPVQSEDDPCPDEPYRARIDVRTASGGLVDQVESGEDGRFRIGLRAGAYVLDPQPGDPFPVAAEVDVVVVEGVYTEVVVHYDTGIR